MVDLKWLSRWLPPILWTLQIFYFSTLPRGSYPKIDEQHFGTNYLQYVYHFGQFFCLSLLLYRAMLRNSVSAPSLAPRKHTLKHTLLAIAIIAFLDEFIQIFVPTRSFTLRDLVTNVAGGGFGLAMMQMVRRSEDVNRGELGRRIAE